MTQKHLVPLVAALLALAPLPALADATPPPGMLPTASNAVVPNARNNLGAAAGNGVNVVTDYGADPTGNADSTAALQNAVNAACNNANPVFQTKEVDIPAGLYLVSGTISITNGCWLRGAGQASLATNAAGTVIRAASSFTSGDLFQFRGFGVLKITDMRLDVNSYFTGGASIAQVKAGGSGYAVNDTITLTGGTFTTATVLKVTSVSGGAVTGAVIVTPGTYSVAPSSVAPVAQGTSSGSGTGATFNVVYANSAAISIAGPETALSADAASGASSLTVGSIANFASGSQINIRLDTGAYYQTTVSGTPSGSTIAIAGTLPAKASANEPVYGLYAAQPVVQNVTCSGYWDCVRLDNVAYVDLTDDFAHDFGHDGFIKINGPTPDGGGDKYVGLNSWDENRGTSNAGFEILAGGDMQIVAAKMLASDYQVLVNSYYGPTGTLLLDGGSYEEAVDCTWKFHQSVAGITYANVNIVGAETSNIANASAQHLCIDAGSAAGWIRNIDVTGNHANDDISAAASLFNIQDGSGVTLTGNIIDNNSTAGPTGIAVGSNASSVTLNGNTAVGLPGGLYGTLNTGSLTPVYAAGGVLSGGALSSIQYNAGAEVNGLHLDNSGTGINITFSQSGNLLQELGAEYVSGAWYFDLLGNGGPGDYVMRVAANNDVGIGPGVPGALLDVQGTLRDQELALTKTSSYQVAVADSGTHFDNSGASGEVDFTLPAYAAGLHYCFTVTAAQTLKVIAPASNHIAVGTSNSAAAGNITDNAVYSTACIYATNVSDQWAAESTTGSWTVN